MWLAASFFGDLVGVDAAGSPSKEEFFKELAGIHERATAYQRSFRGRDANFFTPDLWVAAEAFLKNYPARQVRSLGLSTKEKKEAINLIFYILERFKKRSGNNACGQNLHIKDSCRYKLVQYCFEALYFGGHVRVIIEAFQNISPSVRAQTLYLNEAMIASLESCQGEAKVESFIDECLKKCKSAVKKIKEQARRASERALGRYARGAAGPPAAAPSASYKESPPPDALLLLAAAAAVDPGGSLKRRRL